MSDMGPTAAAQTVSSESDSQQTATLKPVSPDQRIESLDILRGFALIGILLMNIEWFSRPLSDLGNFNHELSGLDHAMAWLIRCFVEGKFYKLLALLFGVGFAVMLTQALKKGRPFGAWFLRRMLVLFVLGILHMFFIWQGDILHDYAFTGLLMLGMVYLLGKKRFEKYNNPSSILKIAVCWATLPILLATLAGLGFSVLFDRHAVTESWHEQQAIRLLVSQLEDKAELGKADNANTPKTVIEPPADGLNIESKEGTKATLENPKPVEDVKLSLEKQAQGIFDTEQETKKNEQKEVIALKEGTYWQATKFRIKASLSWLAITPFFALIMLLPLFLLGYWLVLSGVIQNPAKHTKLFSNMTRLGLGVGLPITVAGLIVMGHPAVEHILLLQGAGNILFMGGQFFMAAGYLGLIITMLDSTQWAKRLSKLAPMGRMALTNYIMQSVILTSIFYGYAGGMYGEISRAAQILIVFAVITLQLVVSNWWLKHCQFGPLEWLWRSLTYKKKQPFKVI